MDERDSLDFLTLFDKQYENQMKLLANGKYASFTGNKTSYPIDDPKLCSYHIQQLISEIGEVLEADKRWKNFRNSKYDKQGKLEEIADCFIVLMNITMFSGFSVYELYGAISNKLQEVEKRISSEE